MSHDESTQALPTLRLRNNEDRRISAGHLWVFSNEVDVQATPLTAFEAGAHSRVVSARDKFLGYAYVNPHSLICARIVSRDVRYPIERSLIVHRLQVALSLRERLYQKPFYRLVYGESDGLPGLVIDRYGDVLVAQIATAGMEALKPAIEAAVGKVFQHCALLWKNDSGARELEGLPSYVEVALGEVPETVEIEEHGVSFRCPVKSGQKTGWFFDQAANRSAFLKYVRGRSVLDVFSYLGGWGLAAARAGASAVTCVDSSASAIQELTENAARNDLNVTAMKSEAFDALEKLHEEKRRFDIVVIDPPAFIKRKKDQPKGEAAYKRLNQLAMQVLERDGILISCSCSHHLDSGTLIEIIQRASRHVARFTQIIEVGGQSPDHPIHPAIPETRYLKAYFCRVTGE